MASAPPAKPPPPSGGQSIEKQSPMSTSGQLIDEEEYILVTTGKNRNGELQRKWIPASQMNAEHRYVDEEGVWSPHEIPHIVNGKEVERIVPTAHKNANGEVVADGGVWQGAGSVGIREGDAGGGGKAGPWGLGPPPNVRDPGAPAWAQAEQQYLRNLAADQSGKAEQSQMRGMYMDALADLGRRAQGADSVVERQALAEQERLRQGIASQLASAGGRYNPALQRTAMMQQAGLGAQMSADIAAARAAEQQAAQDAYLRSIAAGRTQDIGMLGQDRQYQLGLEGLGARYMGMGLDEAADRDRLGLGRWQAMSRDQQWRAGQDLQRWQTQQQMQLAREQMAAQKKNWFEKYVLPFMNAGATLGAAGMKGGGSGGGGGGGGGGLPNIASDDFSYDEENEPLITAATEEGSDYGMDERAEIADCDVRAKQNIAPQPPGVEQFMDTLQPYSYEYKSPQYGQPGRHLGVMAQDLARTPLGQQMVTQDQRSGMLGVDTRRATPAALAAVGNLHQRLRRIEQPAGRPMGPPAGPPRPIGFPPRPAGPRPEWGPPPMLPPVGPPPVTSDRRAKVGVVAEKAESGNISNADLQRLDEAVQKGKARFGGDDSESGTAYESETVYPELGPAPTHQEVPASSLKYSGLGPAPGVQFGKDYQPPAYPTQEDVMAILGGPGAPPPQYVASPMTIERPKPPPRYVASPLTIKRPKPPPLGPNELTWEEALTMLGTGR